MRGSGRQPYTTSVWLDDDLDDAEVAASSCSCPIGGECMHVAASLLAYYAKVVADPLPGVPGARRRAADRRRPALRRAAPQPPQPPPPPAWRTALGALTRSDNGLPGGPGPSGYQPLGLQLRVDGLKQALESAGQDTRLAAPPRLMMRPVQRGASGAWAGGCSVGWRPGGCGGSLFDPRIASWLAELGQLWSGRSDYGYGYYGAPEWRAVEEFAASVFWPLLADGVRMGGALVGNAARDRVELAATADIALEATAAGDDGLRLRQRVTFNDEPTAYDVLGMAGAAGLYRVQLADKSRPPASGPHRSAAVRRRAGADRVRGCDRPRSRRP